MSEGSDDDNPEFLGRFEAVVLAAADRQVQAMSDQLQGEQRKLTDALSDKEQVALALAAANADQRRLREALAKAEKGLREESVARSSAENSTASLQTALGRSEKEVSALAARLQVKERELSVKVQSANDLQAACDVFKGDVNLHKAMQEATDRRLTALEAELTGTQRALRASQREVAAAAAAKQEADAKALAEREAAHRAQTEFDRVIQNLQLATATKTMLVQQWQGALSAMNKRDEALAAMQERVAATKTEADALQQAAQTAEREAERTEDRNQALEAQVAQLTLARDKAAAAAQAHATRHRTAAGELRTARSQVAQLSAQLADQSEQLESALDRATEAKAERSAAAAQLHSHRNKPGESAEEAARQVAAAEREAAEAQAAVQRTRAELEAECVLLRNRVQLAENRAEHHATEARSALTQLRLKAQEQAAAREEYGKLQQVSSQLRDSTHVLAHRANSNVAELARVRDQQESEALTRRQLEQRAQRDEQRREDDHGKIRDALVRSQAELLAARARERQLEAQVAKHEHDARVRQATTERLDGRLKEQQSTTVERMVAVDEARVQLRSSTKQVFQLQAEREQLQRGVADAEAMLGLREAEYQSAWGQAKGQMSMMQRQLGEARLANAELVNDKEILTRHKMAAEGAMAYLKKQAADAKDDAYVLRREMNQLQTEHAQLQKQMAKYVKHMGAQALAATARRGSPRSASASASAPTTSTSTSGDPERVRRAETLAAERLNDVVQLQQQIEDLVAEREAFRSRQGAGETATLRRSNLELRSRCLRAESVAAHLDSQLRGLHSDAQISYAYLPDVVPQGELATVLSQAVLSPDDICRSPSPPPKLGKSKSSKPVPSRPRLRPGRSLKAV